MRPGFLNTCLASLYILIASAASPRDQYDHLPEPDLNKEPTCDELRAMWRFSKRQSRAAESTNEIPTYRDPFAYNIWEDHARIRSAGGSKLRRPPVYGRLVHSFQGPRIYDGTPERVRAFEEVARLFGTSVHVPEINPYGRRKPTTFRLVGGNGPNQMHSTRPQKGSFQHLKEIIQAERARELHEQKMSENAARTNRLRNQRMMTGYGRDDINYKANRSRARPLPYQNVMAPSPSNDLYSDYSYIPRTDYPENQAPYVAQPVYGRLNL